MIQHKCQRIWQKIKEDFREDRFALKPTLKLSAIFLLAMSAILRANFFYHDDIQRACWGWPGWGFSRHLTNFLSFFLHAGSYLGDISPFPQILAAGIIALACVLAVYMITGEKKISNWFLVAAIPMGLSPYFLECLSFKYDAPYMALSVLLSIFPLKYREKNPWGYVLLTAVCMLGMCMTYQASSGIFPMLVILLGLIRWRNGENTLKVMKFYGISAAGFLLGLLIYQKGFMAEVSAYASTSVAPTGGLIACAIANYKKYLVRFIQGFTPAWLALSFIICICFLWTMVSGSRKNKVGTFFLTGFIMGLLFLMSFGAYPFLTEPLFYPRAMYGIGCFLAFLGIFAVSAAPKGYGAKLACGALSWCLFLFAFTYGNALNVQATYTDYRITEVVEELMKWDGLEASDEITLQITGSIGYAPGLQNMISAYPMIEKLVPVTFQGDGWWGEFGFRYYYGLPEMKFAESYDPPEKDIPIISHSYLHTIHAYGEDVWIELYETGAQRTAQ